MSAGQKEERPPREIRSGASRAGASRTRTSRCGASARAGHQIGVRRVQGGGATGGQIDRVAVDADCREEPSSAGGITPDGPFTPTAMSSVSSTRIPAGASGEAGKAPASWSEEVLPDDGTRQGDHGETPRRRVPSAGVRGQGEHTLVGRAERSKPPRTARSPVRSHPAPPSAAARRARRQPGR